MRHRLPTRAPRADHRRRDYHRRTTAPNCPRRPGALAVLATCAALCIAACRTSDGDARLPVASAWTAASPAHRGPLSPEGWLADLPSAEVRPLVREALAHNHDLQAAAARMRAARARSVIAGADRLPHLDAAMDSSRARSVAADDLRQRANDFALALHLSWEIDLWGRLRDQRSAARLEAQASAADLRAARLSVAANTAKAWFNAVEAERQVTLARDTLANFNNNLDIIQRAFDAGVAEPGADAALDLRLARANVATAENQLAAARRSRDAAARSLEVLLGRYPSNTAAIATELPALGGRQVPAGLPSQLLVRRPDLIAAETRLAAAGLQLRAARKAFLPGFTLTARGGTRTEEFARLLDAERLVASIAAGIVQPVVDGGRLRGEVALTEAQRDELLHGYAQAALEALREVETALAAEHFLARQEAALVDAARESAQAEELALDQYGRGLVDIITVLDSQRRAFEARRALIAVRNERLQNRVDLHLALGGGFERERPPGADPQ